MYPNKSISQKNGCFTVECDEMWSFVGLKRNKQWTWLAIDSDSREIVGMPFVTPIFVSVYEQVLPQNRH